MIESSKISVATDVLDRLGNEVCKLHDNIEILSKRLEPLTYNNDNIQKDVDAGAMEPVNDMPEYFKSIHYRVEQLDKVNQAILALVNKLGI